MRSPVLRTLSAVLTTLVVACSLTIDEEELGGDRVLECSDEQKVCDVEGVPECVGLRDASFGCESPNCIPCNLPNAIAICSQNTGKCAVGSCHGAWFNCNGVTSDGCEVDLAHRVDHCGECDAACPERPHAEVGCGNFNCYIRQCEYGFLNCNERFDDGCEIDGLTDVENCKYCNTPCDGVCNNGVCETQ